MELSERDLIYILNCLDITKHYLTYHTLDEKKYLSYYYNFDNYDEDFDSIQNLHRRMSLHFNNELYNLHNEIFFKGQSDYMASKEKDFVLLREKNRYCNIKITKKLCDEKIPKNKNFFIFRYLLDKI